MKLSTLAIGLGLVIPFWLLGGVLLVAHSYPGYDHSQQAMSELGALGAPTHFISPLINNYPLGLMFVLFGYAVLTSFRQSRLEQLSGLLLIVHGMGSVAAGIFSCDVGCNPSSTLNSQLLHNLSGFVMFLSLLLAGSLWVYLAFFRYKQPAFGCFSLACTLMAIAVLPSMATAVQTGEDFGFFQRLNYGASVIWVAGFSLFLLARLKSAVKIV